MTLYKQFPIQSCKTSYFRTIMWINILSKSYFFYQNHSISVLFFCVVHFSILYFTAVSSLILPVIRHRQLSWLIRLKSEWSCQDQKNYTLYRYGFFVLSYSGVYWHAFRRTVGDSLTCGNVLHELFLFYKIVPWKLRQIL